MDSSSCSSSNENTITDYSTYYDMSYESSIVTDAISEASTEEYFSFYDNHSSVTGSFYGEYDDFLDDSRFYDDTDSSIEDGRTESYTTSRSTPDSSLKSSSVGLKGSLSILPKGPPNHGGGILKSKSRHIQDELQERCDTKITQETLDKLRETELEDVLQYARDIIKPDPKAKLTFCTQPVKVVEGSFRHLISVKELYSKTGAFKYRTICVTRNIDEEVGISVRRGDGWEKGEGIYISRVSLGSIYDQYEVVRVGDEIIQVNKVNVKKMSADDVIRLMHIPEKLSVTVKMLTPFSKKRVAQSGLDALKYKNNNLQTRNKSHPAISQSNESLYKVAHLQIGNEKRNTYTDGQLQKYSNRHSNNINNKNREQNNKNVKISPYRSMEGGRSMPPPTKPCLSPIREFANTSPDLPAPTLRRKQSYVRWFDES